MGTSDQARPEGDVREACERVAAALCRAPGSGSVEVVPTVAEVGGGSLPGHALPSWAVALSAPGRGAEQIARALRKAPLPVFGRIEKDRLLLDLRAVDPDEEGNLIATASGIV
jgi:L-seryl-tRNA(Ser) seleniumtransferase